MCYYVSTHTLAPQQSGGVVLFDEWLHLSPDRQVGAHPVHMTSVTGGGQEGGQEGIQRQDDQMKKGGEKGHPNFSYYVWPLEWNSNKWGHHVVCEILCLYLVIEFYIPCKTLNKCKFDQMYKWTVHLLQITL